MFSIIINPYVDKLKRRWGEIKEINDSFISSKKY